MQGPAVAEPADAQRRVAFLDDARDLHPGVDHHVGHVERIDPRSRWIPAGKFRIFFSTVPAIGVEGKHEGKHAKNMQMKKKKKTGECRTLFPFILTRVDRWR